MDISLFTTENSSANETSAINKILFITFSTLEWKSNIVNVPFCTDKGRVIIGIAGMAQLTFILKFKVMTYQNLANLVLINIWGMTSAWMVNQISLKLLIYLLFFLKFWTKSIRLCFLLWQNWRQSISWSCLNLTFTLAMLPCHFHSSLFWKMKLLSLLDLGLVWTIPVIGTSCLFLENFGGLGVINPTTTYIAKKISFLLSTLNSDDPQTRHSARSSLELHMKKRRVDKNNIDSSFAGYCTDENGRLVKQCAVNWPKSVWIELNELCMREGLRLEMSGDEYVYISSLDNEVAIVLRNQSTTFNHIKSQHLNNRITRFKTKISQGRILSTPCIDFQISNNYLTNTAINDNLVKFIFKTRLQLLECNSLLHRYYPRVYPKSCLLCNNPFDTASHVLNGCMIFNDMYIKRHDRIVNHIHSQLTTSRPQFTGSVQMYRKWFVFLQQSKISHFSFCNPHFSFSNLL